jgi:hypothetical protein
MESERKIARQRMIAFFAQNLDDGINRHRAPMRPKPC